MNTAPASSVEETIDFYQRNAKSYFDATRQVDQSNFYQPFLKNIPDHGKILDAGSGSGRDTLAFIKLGYHVDAFDASSEMASLSTALTGKTTRVMRFEDLSVKNYYDGVWASASLLHIPAEELSRVLETLGAALKKGGSLYCSFKFGEGERIAEDGRYFLDMNESKLHKVMCYASLSVESVWVSEGADFNLKQERWLNAILRKNKHLREPLRPVNNY